MTRRVDRMFGFLTERPLTLLGALIGGLAGLVVLVVLSFNQAQISGDVKVLRETIVRVESKPSNVRGPRGLRGRPGVRGPAGRPGPVGPQGLTGARGPRGFAGSRGPRGRDGAPGLTNQAAILRSCI